MMRHSLFISSSENGKRCTKKAVQTCEIETKLLKDMQKQLHVFLLYAIIIIWIGNVTDNVSENPEFIL